MKRVILLLFGVLAMAGADMQQKNMFSAIVRLKPQDASTANVTGELRIVQGGFSIGPVPAGARVTGKVYGLSPGLHGLHVHEKGDMQNGCMSAGGYYNPTNAKPALHDCLEACFEMRSDARHGGEKENLKKSKSSASHYVQRFSHQNNYERWHKGDLGNIRANDQGEASVDIGNSSITLTGPYSILGRSIIVHAGGKDLGTENQKFSLINGNFGNRVACGIVAVSEKPSVDDLSYRIPPSGRSPFEWVE